MIATQPSEGYANRIEKNASLGERQLEIPHQLDKLDRNLAACQKAVEELEGRLCTSILRPNAPTPAAAGSSDRIAAAIPNTPTGSRLHDTNHGLAALYDRIQGLIARLEA